MVLEIQVWELAVWEPQESRQAGREETFSKQWLERMWNAFIQKVFLSTCHIPVLL